MSRGAGQVLASTNRLFRRDSRGTGPDGEFPAPSCSEEVQAALTHVQVDGDFSMMNSDRYPADLSLWLRIRHYEYAVASRGTSTQKVGLKLEFGEMKNAYYLY